MEKERIQQIINIFETGSKNGDYSNVTIFADGPGGIKQITYGRSQTTQFSNLRELLSDYVELNGKYSEQLKPYLDRIKDKNLYKDVEFINLIKNAAKEDPKMIKAQDDFFDRRYWKPAYDFFESNGFTLPLSMLVIYDSYIHGGLSIVRKRFMEVPPARGGDEKEWVIAYVKSRHQWLKYHKRTILNKTIYRTQLFLDLINNSNWNLSTPIHFRGHTV